MTERRRMAVVLLAAAGALIGHSIGYAIAGVALGERHEYLSTIGQFVVPIGLAAAAVLVVRSARSTSLDGTSVSWRHLAGTQMALFTAQEMVESGFGSIHGAAMILGLAAQIPVAYLLWRVVEFGATVLAAALATSPTSPAAGNTSTTIAPQEPTVRQITSWFLRRGPPSVLHHTI